MFKILGEDKAMVEQLRPELVRAEVGKVLLLLLLLLLLLRSMLLHCCGMQASVHICPVPVTGCSMHTLPVMGLAHIRCCNANKVCLHTACTIVCLHASKCTCTPIYTLMRGRVRKHTHTRTRTCTHIHACVRMHIRAHAHTPTNKKPCCCASRSALVRTCPKLPSDS